MPPELPRLVSFEPHDPNETNKGDGLAYPEPPVRATSPVEFIGGPKKRPMIFSSTSCPERQAGTPQPRTRVQEEVHFGNINCLQSLQARSSLSEPQTPED